MSDHATIASAINSRTIAAWEQYRAWQSQATELTILQLAHTVLAAFPQAQYLWLAEHDEADHLVVNYLMLTDGRVIGDSDGAHDPAHEEPLDDDDEVSLDLLANDIDAIEMSGRDFWIEHGTKHSGRRGEFDPHKAIEILGPKYQAYTAPMPDPTDKAALTTWLDKD